MKIDSRRVRKKCKIKASLPDGKSCEHIFVVKSSALQMSKSNKRSFPTTSGSRRRLKERENCIFKRTNRSNRLFKYYRNWVDLNNTNMSFRRRIVSCEYRIIAENVRDEKSRRADNKITVYYLLTGRRPLYFSGLLPYEQIFVHALTVLVLAYVLPN